MVVKNKAQGELSDVFRNLFFFAVEQGARPRGVSRCDRCCPSSSGGASGACMVNALYHNPKRGQIVYGFCWAQTPERR